MATKKLFTYDITEFQGEQEYTFHRCLYAEDQEEADLRADADAAFWYGEDEDGDPEGIRDGDKQRYNFYDMGIAVEYTTPQEEDKQAFMERLFQITLYDK